LKRLFIEIDEKFQHEDCLPLQHRWYRRGADISPGTLQNVPPSSDSGSLAVPNTGRSVEKAGERPAVGEAMHGEETEAIAG